MNSTSQQTAILDELCSEPLDRDEQHELADRMQTARSVLEQHCPADTAFHAFLTSVQQDPESHGCADAVNDYLEARNRLVLSAGALAVNYTYNNAGELPDEECLANCLYYLVRAAENFDPDAGTKFSTLAYFYLKKARRITARNHNASFLSFSRSEYQDFLDSDGSLKRFSLVENRSDNGPEPKPGRIGMDSRDELTTEPPDLDANRRWVRSMLDKFARNHLTDQQSVIFRDYCVNKTHTIQQLADRFGVTTQSVRQRKDRALELLARWPLADKLKRHVETTEPVGRCA